MHEMSLIRALLRQVHTLCRRHGTGRASVIRLSVGAFCGADPRLLRSAYELATEGQGSGRAELVISEVPLEAGCDLCEEVFRVDHFDFTCPACGSCATRIVRGNDLLLESVTFERPEADGIVAPSQSGPP